jgi:saccharopine dehydrogenase-like NADP-dependent oxidoreductase
MLNVLVAGAGKSSTWLIKYLLQHASRSKWIVTVADGNAQNIESRIGDHPAAKSAVFDITNDRERRQLVQNADIVVSLMPPQLHVLLAKDCLEFRKNLITSSYISPEMKELDKAVQEAGLMFMCEMGLDPGIDHMTANQIIHSIQRVAGELTSFSSYCGGLIAPESDDNPWHYKFSWNPRNIIDAGKAGAAFLKAGANVEVDYEGIFRKNETIEVAGHGRFAWYPNRDSLKYLDVYEVPDATTFLRATLRHPDFLVGWNALVRLGATDSETLSGGNPATYAEWMKALSNYSDTSVSLRDHVANVLQLKAKEKVLKMLDWLGLFSDDAIPAGRMSNGDLLLSILETKWEMRPEDKDMVVMQHEVEYRHRGRENKLISSMVIKGENRELSAMAKTVGLPMGILTRMVTSNKLRLPQGVLIPNMPAIYRPVMNELIHYGIEFHDLNA